MYVVSFSRMAGIVISVEGWGVLIDRVAGNHGGLTANYRQATILGDSGHGGSHRLSAESLLGKLNLGPRPRHRPRPSSSCSKIGLKSTTRDEDEGRKKLR